MSNLFGILKSPPPQPNPQDKSYSTQVLMSQNTKIDVQNIGNSSWMLELDYIPFA